MVGVVQYEPENLDGCKEIDEKALVPLDSRPLFKILLVDRGSCTFVKKVTNAELAGMSAVIVVDNVDWEDVEYVIMSDDGYGEGISIPSMLISNQAGNTIKDFLEKSTQEELEALVVSLTFDIAAPDDHVEYDLWYTSSDDRSLDFLVDLSEYDVKFGSAASFTPRFVYWECFFCDKEVLEKHCFAGGKYCAVDMQNEKIHGREIMREDLRQKCLWQHAANEKSNMELFWGYIKYAHANCGGVINENCSKEGMKKVGVKFAQIEKCVDDSFSGTDYDDAALTNSLIDADIEKWLQIGTMRFPLVVINNFTFRGHLDAYGVAEAICGGFQHKNKCDNFNLPDFKLKKTDIRKKDHY